jgi:hypothetical protein
VKPPFDAPQLQAPPVTTFPNFAICNTLYLREHSLGSHETWQNLAKRLDAFCAKNF